MKACEGREEPEDISPIGPRFGHFRRESSLGGQQLKEGTEEGEIAHNGVLFLEDVLWTDQDGGAGENENGDDRPSVDRRTCG
jgi:hypothetical protein